MLISSPAPSSSNGSRPTVIDLFAGAGGLSLGFEQAGFDIAAAVEYDPIHMATHEFNFPETVGFPRDVRNITGAEILTSIGHVPGEVHSVIGGAPCQGFSLIGKRALDDPRNELVAEFARLVFEIQPRYFVFENVAGLATGKHRKFLDELINFFENHGYQVRKPVRVLQAAEHGVPQSRKRLFLLGARNGLQLPDYPPSSNIARNIKGTLPISSSMPLSPSVYEAIGDLPDADAFPELLYSDEVQTEFKKPVSDYAAQMRGILPPNHYGHIRPHDPSYLTSSARTKHTETSTERFNATPPGTTEPISRFLRLHPDGVSNTLRAGTASDRGAHTSPRPLHPIHPRVITVREAARLHGYPDWFRFHVTKWHGFRQIGNSVPPPLAQAVAAELLQADHIAPTAGGIITGSQHRSLLAMNATETEAYYGITERVIPQRIRH